MNKDATPYLAEFLGTFGFVFISAGAVLIDKTTAGSIGLLGIALANGLALTALIYAFVHVSGAHLNPAVTISLWVNKRVSSGVATGYIISQLVGGVMACIFLEGFFAPVRQIVPTPGELSTLSAIAVEAILTFFLTIVVYGASIDRKSHTSHGGLSIGLVLATLVLIGYNLTGGIMNPAKAFGPAFVGNLWQGQLVYWIGPILGAVVAGIVYEYGILKGEGK